MTSTTFPECDGEGDPVQMESHGDVVERVMICPWTARIEIHLSILCFIGRCI